MTGHPSDVMRMVERWAHGLRALRKNGNTAGQYIARMRIKMQMTDRLSQVSVKEDNHVTMTIHGTTYEVDSEGAGFIRVQVEKVSE